MGRRTSTEASDGRRFDVTVHTTDGERITVPDVPNSTAREFEDLPFTAPHVDRVDVEQRR